MLQFVSRPLRAKNGESFGLFALFSLQKAPLLPMIDPANRKIVKPPATSVRKYWSKPAGCDRTERCNGRKENKSGYLFSVISTAQRTSSFPKQQPIGGCINRVLFQLDFLFFRWRFAWNKGMALENSNAILSFLNFFLRYPSRFSDR